VLHPEAHAFFNQSTHQEEPDIIAPIMTQLSMKADLKQWGGKATKGSPFKNEASLFQRHLQAIPLE
jgi:hypothetical protein